MVARQSVRGASFGLRVDVSGGYVVFFHQGMKVGSLHSHFLGGLGDISIAGFQRLNKKCFFGLTKLRFQKLFFDLFKFFESFRDSVCAAEPFFLELI